jgi:hypothetical protein
VLRYPPALPRALTGNCRKSDRAAFAKPNHVAEYSRGRRSGWSRSCVAPRPLQHFVIAKDVSSYCNPLHPVRGSSGQQRGPAGAEAAYHAWLSEQQHAGAILWHKFEALKLRLADNAFYTPDFMVLAADSRLELHEVKGFWQDDARVTIKVAASLYPFRSVGSGDTLGAI